MNDPRTMSEGLVWAIDTYYRLRGKRIDRVRLADGVSSLDATVSDWSGLAQLMKQLEMVELRVLVQPDTARLPLMAYVAGQGWGVLVKVRDADSWVLQTAQGERHVLQEDLLSNVAEIDFPETGEQQGSAASQGTGFHTALRAAFRNRRTALLDVVLASLAINAISMALSLYSMQVYDRVIATHGLNTLLVLASGTLLALVFELALKLARSRVTDVVVVGVDTYLSRHIFQRLLSIRVDQLPGSVGTLASQLRSYEQVRSFYTSSTMFAVIDLPMGILFLAVILTIAGPLLAVVPSVILVIATVNGLIYRARFNAMALTGNNLSNKKTGLLVEAVEGAETIKAGGGGWKFLQRWTVINNASLQNEKDLRHNNDHLGYATAILTQLSYIGIVTIGAWQAMEGQITTGGLVAASILGGRVMAPIGMIPSLLVQHAQAQAAKLGLERLYALETDHAMPEKTLRPSVIHGNYHLEDVQFSYFGSRGNSAALKIEQLDIAAGERVGILGPVGSGKSTLLRLLSGMYAPQQGRILLDGLGLGQIDRQSLSEQIGYVQQDTRLFEGTLRDNLLIGLLDPGDDLLFSALKRSGLSALVSAHPRGLDLPIFEGGRGLSGGQRQLVAFTRLLLSRPNVLLLDEPTASMDDDLERRCLGTLSEELTPDKTLIVVTHKMTLLPLVKRLIVIVGNRIIMDSSRDEVVKRLSQPPLGAMAHNLGGNRGATP